MLLLYAAFLPDVGISAMAKTEGTDIGTWLIQDYSDSDEDEDEIPLTPPSRHRIPAKGIYCNISSVDGITIPGMDVSEIVSFEIRDAYGNTVAILTDEASFIETLFYLSGEYRLIFRLPGRTLAGWILI